MSPAIRTTNNDTQLAIEESHLLEFCFDETPVPFRMVDGKPWWVAKVVCDILGIGNVSMACQGLHEHQKRISSTDTSTGPKPTLMVSESGLYKLALRSRKPAAMRFSDWLTEEVLPAIRKTGSYSVAGTTNRAVDARVEQFLDMHHALASEIETLKQERAQRDARVDERFVAWQDSR